MKCSHDRRGTQQRAGRQVKWEISGRCVHRRGGISVWVDWMGLALTCIMSLRAPELYAETVEDDVQRSA